MLRLYVLRHAKSSWAVPGAGDFDRELSERGKDDLVLVSDEIMRNGYVPKKILCSPSVRTRQTLDGIADALIPTPEIEFVEKLYSGGLEDYLTVIKAAGTCESLMTIGHNPMSGSLASSLAGGGDLKAMEKIAYKYPTSAISVLDFDIDNWADIRRGTGTLVTCIFPSALRK